MPSFPEGGTAALEDCNNSSITWWRGLKPCLVPEAEPSRATEPGMGEAGAQPALSLPASFLPLADPRGRAGPTVGPAWEGAGRKTQAWADPGDGQLSLSPTPRTG